MLPPLRSEPVKPHRYLTVILMLAFAGSQPFARAETTVGVQECMVALDPVREDLLGRIYKIEQHFVQMTWQEWKYRQTIYVHVWEAHQQSQDGFSLQNQARGEVAYQRYDHLAGVYREMADEERRSLQIELNDVKGVGDRVDGECDALQYQDCFKTWFKEIMENFDLFQKRIEYHMYQLQEARLQVELALNDKPSEHHDFGDRYYDLHGRWMAETYPSVLLELNRLREAVEFEWPSAHCCDFCTAENVEAARNPLHQYVRPDPEASMGVEGGALGRANVVTAFEQMEDPVEDDPIEEESY